MQDEFDLGAYFERIGYGGPAVPRLDTLCEIHRLHPQAIAFENLNPLMHWPVLLDAQSLQQKLVAQRRGGYCYEHNLLLRDALLTLGFTVTGLAARVLWNRPLDAVTPRSHMLLLVDGLDGGRRIADTGFGGSTPTASLRLETGTMQTTPHGDYRLLDLAGDYALQASVRDEWRTLYRFDLAEQHPVDYEAPNWYLSTNPSSGFVTRLTAARAAEGHRIALNGLDLAVHHVGGPTERRTLSGVPDLRAALADDLLINTAGLDLDRAFAKLRAA
jgi:N-hydroxyarylamine O-acetyltransferase